MMVARLLARLSHNRPAAKAEGTTAAQTRRYVGLASLQCLIPGIPPGRSPFLPRNPTLAPPSPKDRSRLAPAQPGINAHSPAVVPAV
jgi:hypothetical protein